MADLSLSKRREKKKVKQLQYVSNVSFENYIRDMVQLLHTHVGSGRHGGKASISKEALQIADSVIMDMFEDIATEARKLVVYDKRRTLMAWDIQCAVMQRLRGEVARHAMSEGQKAVTRYLDMIRH